jgi:hypothetical protein
MSKESIPAEYIVVGIVQEENKTRFLELVIKRGTQRYLISVADKEYIQDLNELNQSLDPEYRWPDNILELDQLDPIEAVQQQLSSLPDEILNSYADQVIEEKV